MNYFLGKKCYLSGPIENCTEKVNWREEVIKNLETNFGLDVFDPFSDPKQQWLPVLHEAKKNNDLETIVKICKSFVRKDLAMVDRADILIAYLRVGVLTTGTHHEIINSNNAKKPTLLVTNGASIMDIPSWYFGFIPTECMFVGWDNLYKYLNEVNEGKHSQNNRWDYVCNKI